MGGGAAREAVVGEGLPTEDGGVGVDLTPPGVGLVDVPLGFSLTAPIPMARPPIWGAVSSLSVDDAGDAGGGAGRAPGPPGGPGVLFLSALIPPVGIPSGLFADGPLGVFGFSRSGPDLSTVTALSLIHI